MIDLHTHSAVSDGTDTPAELVANAAAAGLSVVALTDHDTFDGLAEAMAAGERIGVEVVPGLELSCTLEHQSVHLLAYGADAADADLAAEMALVRDGRTGRLRPVLAKLAELGVPVSEEEVLAFVGSSPSVGRPHIADALVAAGHVKDRKEAFDRFLADGGPAHVGRYAIDIGRGIDLVHGAGGVAVIAHPGGGAASGCCRPRCWRSWSPSTVWTASRWTTKITTPRPGQGCGSWPSGSGCWPPGRATTTARARWTTTSG